MPHMCFQAGIHMMRTGIRVIQFTDEKQSWLSNIGVLVF